ncbi:MAG: hypothetical protein AB1422_11290 [bacterium]
MTQNEERKGVLSQIIVAVVVTLLVGGTAPWWWDIIAPEKSQEKPDGIPTWDGQIQEKPDGIPTRDGQIQVRCTASPHSIPAGGQVGITVLAFTEQSSPVSSANVRIEAGGGWFSRSGTTIEVGQTDAGGVFMTQWRSPNPAAGAYGMNVTVTKDGFTEGRDECNIPIQ